MPNLSRLFALTLLAACHAVFADLPVVREHYPLGDTAAVGIARYCVAGSAESDGRVLLYQPHENETTARRTALAVLATRGRGCLLALEQHGRRRIAFDTADGRADFDPNRIYTAQGRAATLARGGNSGAEAQYLTAAFADTLLTRYLARTRLIIAVHNNTDGATDIERYLNGGLGSAEVFINPGHDPDDYVFTIDAAAFAYFKAHGFNVVRQDNDTVPDDGSLSVYAARHGIGYINVEAQYGHTDAQAAMLQAALAFAGGDD